MSDMEETEGTEGPVAPHRVIGTPPPSPRLLGSAALIWVRHLMPNVELTEERHELRSDDADRQGFQEVFKEGTGYSQFVKRPLIRRTLMLGTLPLLAAPVVLLRDLGPRP